MSTDPFDTIAPVDGVSEPVRADDWRDALPPADFTEDGLAIAFTRKHGPNVSYDHEIGSWARWCDISGRWLWDDRRLAFHWIRELIRDQARSEKASKAEKLRRRSTAAAVEEFAKCDPVHSVTHEVWDSDPMLLGCPGATVNLQTGESYQPRRDDRITKQTAVAPDFAADCPVWKRFLSEALCGDEGLLEFAQVWAGYLLSGSTKEHKMLFIWGEGGNGKSIFLNTLAGMMGDYATTAAMEVFAESRFERHSTELAALRGSRLVAVSEVAEGQAWNQQRLTALTGGDRIRARFMRQDGFEFTPNFKLMIVGNHKPVLNNVTEAMKRRMMMLPFLHKPKRPNFELEAQLREEWPAIMAWALLGLDQWRAEGLPMPEAIVAATEEYFDAQDTFGAWLGERVTVDPGSAYVYDTSARLYGDWKKYAEDRGEVPGSSKRFGERLSQRGFRPQRERVDGVLKRIWRGIQLKSDLQ